MRFLACSDRDMFRSKYARRVRSAGEGTEGGDVLAAPATSYSRDLIEYMTADAWYTLLIKWAGLELLLGVGKIYQQKHVKLGTNLEQ